MWCMVILCIIFNSRKRIMNKLLFIAIFSVAVVNESYSQAKVRKLPASINHPAINLYAPYMSFDGDALVFISDNAEDYELTPFYTFREGNADWKTPFALPKSINTKLNFLRGFTLGPEGKFLYFTSMKSPGVGGYDIWVSERKGSTLAEPRNLVAPINSKAHEACATITPDGKTMYFMRCDKMDQKSASGCKIFMASKKSNGQWDEPQELPSNINTGNSQAPRIMADSEMLIFSSDKFPGNKGGMDLYMTKFTNGTWSNPVPLDFANTPTDDQFISVNAQGRYLLRDSPGARKSELVEYLIPTAFRPRGLMRVEGKVLNANGAAVPAYISVMDSKTSKRTFNGRPAADGSFTLFLIEGTRYELSIDPEQSDYTFYSKTFDLTGDQIPQIERLSATLKKVESGDDVMLNMVTFKPYSSELEQSSINELKRASRLISGNPALSYEIQVMLAGYVEDSVRSTPDLTEIQIDSVINQITDIDTLGQLYKRDTLIAKVTYHNNRTAKQAESIINYFVSAGIPPERLSSFVNSRPEAIEEKRKIEVHLRAKK